MPPTRSRPFPHTPVPLGLASPPAPAPGDQPPLRPRNRPLGMHADVPTWCDCCTCEPEPRWQAVQSQAGDETGQGQP